MKTRLAIFTALLLSACSQAAVSNELTPAESALQDQNNGRIKQLERQLGRMIGDEASLQRYTTLNTLAELGQEESSGLSGRTPTSTISNLQNLQELQDRFNTDAGATRLILLLSPT